MPTVDMNVKVRLHGVEYWWLRKVDNPEGPIAPLSHCDEQGNLLPEHCFERSHAYVTDEGNIMRYHAVIGTIADFELL